MDLTSSSWSVWLHLFSFHSNFAANFLPWSELTGFFNVGKNVGRPFQQIANEACLYLSSCLFVFSLLDGPPEGVQQSVNFHSPHQRPAPLKTRGRTESVSIPPP